MNRAGEAREALGLAQAYFELFAKQVDELVNSRISSSKATEVLEQLYEFVPGKPIAEQHHNRVKSLEETLDLLAHPTNTISGMEGTKWALFNAITFHIDHQRAIRGSEFREDRRLDNSWFGGGVKLRQRAYDLLVN